MSFIHRNFKLLLIIYFATLWFVFRYDPFFGDAITSTSRAATAIHDSNFRTVFYPKGFDPGHPVTYPLMMAIAWKIFGRNLVVSHLFGIIWTIVLLLAFRRICRLYLTEKQVNIATLFAMMQPTFITQSAMMLNTAMLMALFLWAVYALLKEHWIFYTGILALMMLSHLQAAFLMAALAGTDLLIQKRQGMMLEDFIRRRFLIYGIPFLAFVGWQLLHHRHAGFWIISPDYSDGQQTNTIGQLVKSLMYCTWRFLDYGMFVPVIFYFVIKRKNRRWLAPDAVLWSSLLITSFFMSCILKNTIAHRYFLCFELLLLFVFVYEVENYGKRKTWFYSITAVALLAGNFFYYPGKVIADANIRYRDYFQLEPLIYSERSFIEPTYSRAPIANPYRITHLEENKFDIKRFGPKLDTLKCVIGSNISADFSRAELDTLNKWYGYSYEFGSVYINVYLNPVYYWDPGGEGLRKPGKVERFFLKMKRKWK
jgi:hypothetical protein